MKKNQIERTTEPHKLLKYLGILSEKEGDEMLRYLEEHRAVQMRLL